MLKPNHFGKHLTVDCFEADPEAILNTNLIANFLTACVELAKMKVIREADAFYYENELDELDSGVTATVILSTSLASIHTFKRHNYFSFDLFSCKDFDESTLVNYIEEVFSPGDMQINILHRGDGFFR